MDPSKSKSSRSIPVQVSEKAFLRYAIHLLPTIYCTWITEILLGDSIKLGLSRWRKWGAYLWHAVYEVGGQSRNDGIGEFFQLSVLTVRRDETSNNAWAPYWRKRTTCAYSHLWISEAGLHQHLFVSPFGQDDAEDRQDDDDRGYEQRNCKTRSDAVYTLYLPTVPGSPA